MIGLVAGREGQVPLDAMSFVRDFPGGATGRELAFAKLKAELFAGLES